MTDKGRVTGPDTRRTKPEHGAEVRNNDSTPPPKVKIKKQGNPEPPHPQRPVPGSPYTPSCLPTKIKGVLQRQSALLIMRYEVPVETGAEVALAHPATQATPRAARPRDGAERRSSRARRR